MEGSSETWYDAPLQPPRIRLPCLQVSADGKGFLKGIGLWFMLAIPSTYTNTMVRLGLTRNHLLLTLSFS